jgi:hypothetical protein
VVALHGRPPAPRIGIDTGATYGGPLTAIRLPDETLFQSS